MGNVTCYNADRVDVRLYSGDSKSIIELTLIDQDGDSHVFTLAKCQAKWLSDAMKKAYKFQRDLVDNS